MIPFPRYTVLALVPLLLSTPASTCEAHRSGGGQLYLQHRPLWSDGSTCALRVLHVSTLTSIR